MRKKKPSLVVVLVVKVQRHYGMFFAKGPPPPEAGEAREREARVPLAAQFLDKVEDRVEGLLGAAVVGADVDVAAKLEDRGLLARVEARLLEHHHALRLAQDVVVEGALGDAVFRRGLREAHLLGHDGLDGLLQVLPRPRRRLQLQQARVVS